MKTASIIAALCFSSSVDSFQRHGGSGSPFKHKHGASASASARRYKSSASTDGEEGPGRGRRFEAASRQQLYKHHDRAAKRTSLSAATLEGMPDRTERASRVPQFEMPAVGSGDLGDITQVLSASLLITGNTVGSSIVVLPETVGGLGMVCGSTLLFALYVCNLMSGLLLADVAINLHESSDCEVPSSFKEFVDTALRSDAAGTAMAGASLASNTCILAFGLVHAGSLCAAACPGAAACPPAGVGAFAAALALCACTQTNRGLGALANAAVLVLFGTFACLLVPSVAGIADPVGTFLAPGADPDGVAAAAAAAVPLLLSSMSYQNIVPSITKLLDFDRTKSTIAIAIGSFIPLLMYVAFTFAVLGGGLESSMASGAGAAAFATFSASALVGSSVAAVMSLAEEYESIMTSVADDDDDDESCPVQNKFSLPAVALSIAPPTAVALAFANGGDLTAALHFNGAFITPFLYGLLPVILYKSMQKKEANDDNVDITLSSWT